MVAIPFRIDANMGLLIHSKCQFLNEIVRASERKAVYVRCYLNGVESKMYIGQTLRRRNIVAHESPI